MTQISAGFFAARVTKAVERLVDHPKLGRVVPEIKDPSYRELMYQNYRIVYVVAGDSVVIIGVIHAAMDMERQASAREWDIT